MNLEQGSAHEDICSYQPVECWAGNWNDTVTKCGWRGKKSDLLDHVQSTHGLQWVHVGPTMEGAEFGDFDMSAIRIVLLCAFAELFWLTVKHDLDNGIHQGVVYYIGPRSRAALFEYTIEIGKGKYSVVCPTGTCFEDTNQMLNDKRLLHIKLHLPEEISVNPKNCFSGYKYTVRQVLLP